MLEVCPMTLKEDNAFVEQHHRHHGPVAGHKFSIGLSDGEKIVGVAIVGRPVSRYLDDGWTLESKRREERSMIHSYDGFERTPAWTELVPVLVVRVPVMSAEQKAGLRAEIASSILDGLLLLEDGLNYEVVDLPLPRAWTPLLQEDVPEPEPPRPTGRNAAERREILERLRRYRREHGLGCFAALAKVCGKGVTETTLRNLYSGDEVQPIQVWRQVGAGLEKLGVSKSDTRKEGDIDGK